MGNYVVENNATGSLASSINDSVTSITLGSGEGALFPNPTGSQFFYVTVFDSSNNREVMKVTARSTDTMTVVRGQDGSTAQAFSAADSVELRVTAAVLENFAQLDGDNALVGNQTVTGNVTASGTVQGATGTITANATVGGTLGVTGVATFTAQPLYGSDKIDAFPSGTAMLFMQATAPTRWTGSDTYDDYDLRLVSESGGVGGNGGGTTAYLSVFDNRTIAQANLPNATLTFSGTTSSDGAHTHTVTSCNDSGTHPTGSGRSDPTSTTTRTTSSNGAHTHTVSGNTSSINGGVTQTAMDFDVRHRNVIMATKD